jgi:hypothetical protein
MKVKFDSILPVVRVEKAVRKWLKDKARRETHGNEGELIRRWVSEKRAADLEAVAK